MYICIHELVEKLPKYYRSLRVEHFTNTRVQRTTTTYSTHSNYYVHLCFLIVISVEYTPLLVEPNIACLLLCFCSSQNILSRTCQHYKDPHLNAIILMTVCTLNAVELPLTKLITTLDLVVKSASKSHTLEVTLFSIDRRNVAMKLRPVNQSINRSINQFSVIVSVFNIMHSCW